MAGTLKGVRAGKRIALAAVLATAIWGLAGNPSIAATQTQTAVEYYYAAWDYYFVTSFPDEIAILDGGAFGGVWKRTGESFAVFVDPTPGAFATCRFFSTSFAPKSSHFYTPFTNECATVSANPDWQFEAIAFDLQLPGNDGSCPAGMSVLYRLYNNGAGGAPNHRYTTNAATFNRQRETWTFEGNGITGAFACVPANAAQGVWQGQTASGDDLVIIVLENGTYYFLSTGSSSVVLVHGTATADGGAFRSSDARRFTVPFLGVVNASIAGAYTPRSTLNGTLTYASGSVPFTATYDGADDQPASLPNAAGAYTGDLATSGWALGTATLTLSASGSITGSVAGCAINGSATPHGSSAGFDLSVSFDGNACMLGSFAASRNWGIAFYDGSNDLIVVVETPSRSDTLIFVGSK